MEKREKLEKLETKMSRNHETPLARKEARLVFGEGNSDANILFVGEAPGEVENETGRPFVGKAGKFLSGLLGKAGLERSEVYITNLVKFQPPRNRDPDADEVETALPWLEAQIDIVDPSVLVALGRFAGRELTGLKSHSASALVGGWKQSTIADIPVRTLYHPSYLIRGERDLEEIQKTVDDLREIAEAAEEGVNPLDDLDDDLDGVDVDAILSENADGLSFDDLD